MLLSRVLTLLTVPTLEIADAPSSPPQAISPSRKEHVTSERLDPVSHLQPHRGCVICEMGLKRLNMGRAPDASTRAEVSDDRDGEKERRIHPGS